MTVGLTSAPWLCSHLRSGSDFPSDSVVKDLPAKQETWVRALGQEDPLKKGMAIHSSILAWEMPWTEESGGFQSMGPQRIWRNWVTNTFTVNEQPQGKGRHWITSTDHQRLQPQPDLGCEVTQPRDQKHEMKKRSNECLCPVWSALRYVRLSPFYKMKFGVPAAVGSLASIR